MAAKYINKFKKIGSAVDQPRSESVQTSTDKRYNRCDAGLHSPLCTESFGHPALYFSIIESEYLYTLYKEKNILFTPYIII